MYSNEFEGKCKVMEPEKCEEWIWCDINEIPSPQFDASEFAIECFKENKSYKINQAKKNSL